MYTRCGLTQTSGSDKHVVFAVRNSCNERPRDTDVFSIVENSSANQGEASRSKRQKKNPPAPCARTCVDRESQLLAGQAPQAIQSNSRAHPRPQALAEDETERKTPKLSVNTAAHPEPNHARTVDASEGQSRPGSGSRDLFFFKKMSSFR